MDDRERFATALQGLLDAGRKLGCPMVVAVQGEFERKDGFPGALFFQLPTPVDPAMVMSAMMLKDGLQGGLESMVPGLKVKRLNKSDYDHSLAEAEQGGQKVTSVYAEVPKRYLWVGGKEIIDV